MNIQIKKSKLAHGPYESDYQDYEIFVDGKWQYDASYYIDSGCYYCDELKVEVLTTFNDFKKEIIKTIKEK